MTTATMDFQNAMLLNAFQMRQRRGTRACRSKSSVAGRKSRDCVVNSCAAAVAFHDSGASFHSNVGLSSFDGANDSGSVSHEQNVTVHSLVVHVGGVADSGVDIGSVERLDIFGCALDVELASCNTAANLYLDLDLNMDSSYHQKNASIQNVFHTFEIFLVLEMDFTDTSLTGNVNYNRLKLKQMTELHSTVLKYCQIGSKCHSIVDSQFYRMQKYRCFDLLRA